MQVADYASVVVARSKMLDVAVTLGRSWTISCVACVTVSSLPVINGAGQTAFVGTLQTELNATGIWSEGSGT